MSQFKEIASLGLWKNNPGLVQLLGLCPLLAVSNTLTNALGLGVATMLVLIASNATVSLVRHFVPKEIRMAVFVMIIAAFVTAVEQVMTAFAYGLYQSLGIFIPLIVTNCVIMGRAEAFASKNTVGLAAFDGLMMGLGFTAVLVVLGGLREVIGQGTLFDGADLLLGDWAKSLRIEVFHFDAKFLVALLPPGAFIGLGFLIALKKVIDQQRQRKTAPAPVVKAERVRVTTAD
ncbi:electron transport complex subunit E [Gallaecimonas pentaromativorans]|uniref:Ion-translocating oxidoreductase complex subunit E n=1 Tax=Gallaecimonas pentaromativorans TaxID=584787 RepID=A0A3N1PDP2_9GAMM|nr:electron transport complex subunit E [Gallaecimonas pentaromativorans]MED5524316.1 electron transport complex subunit E [Pseudomonadota bacterium]ROQ30074.1 electron transport complex protein RnfE [Gallaecimonas pentaromativorans]